MKRGEFTVTANNMGWVMGFEPMTSGTTIRNTPGTTLYTLAFAGRKTANRRRRTDYNGDNFGGNR